MRQVWITKAGEPEVLQVREAPDPQPGAGELRIRVEASGVNFADIVARVGKYQDAPPIPFVPGYEVAGKVDAVGPGVDESWLAKDVFSFARFGGYADVVCVPEAQAIVRPEAMDARDGAALPVTYYTAYALLVALGGLDKSETVLIHSAGGGVGISATQIAKHIGAKVIGTASASKHDFLKSIGVDHCIDYRTEDYEARVMEITKGQGVELILDALGGASFAKGFRTLAKTGRIGMYGLSSGTTKKGVDTFGFLKSVIQMPWLLFNPVTLMNNNKGAFGVNMGRMWDQQERLRSWADQLLLWYNDGIIKPKIDTSFTFENAAEAHHYLQDRKNIGKVLLTPE